MSLSEKFVTPISRIAYSDLPDDVKVKAKLCILHSFSCTLAGIEARWSKAARTVAGPSKDGASHIWFCDEKAAMTDAAFANASAAQSILHEDIHRDSNAHPGIIIVPSAFAVGESQHASGQQVIAAVVAGYEMMGRFGRGSVNPAFGASGFRPTSVIGTFGSAMAAGILLGLTKEEHLSAFGLSADFVSGINEWAIEGTDDLYIQNGMASGNGVKAAMLAKAGVTAPHGILEGKSGFCQAYDYSLANLEAVNCADGKYVISDVLFKPAPACALVQTTAQIALDIAKQGIRPEHIDKGTILTFALGKEYAGCDFSGPFANLLQARMSNQFNFAASLAHRRISNQNYIDFRNTVVTELAARLNVAVSSAYTAEFPLRQPVQVELLLTNGETRAFFREEPVYLDSDTILEKFYEESDGIYDKNIARQVVDTILHLERLNDVNALNELLAARKRTNPR